MSISRRSARKLQRAYDEGMAARWSSFPPASAVTTWGKWEYMARRAGWLDGRERVEIEVRRHQGGGQERRAMRCDGCVSWAPSGDGWHVCELLDVVTSDDWFCADFKPKATGEVQP